MVSIGNCAWQSAYMSQGLRTEDVPMHESRATTRNFSPAIIELDAAMRFGRLRHDPVSNSTHRKPPFVSS
jgi:hypothetical protein